MRRRDFLRGALAGGAALALPRTSRASVWSEGPKEAAPYLLGAGDRAESVLEIFCYGGLSAFETFYAVEEYGRPDDPVVPNQGWHLFADERPAISAACGVSDPATWLTPWATDANGMSVKLGPSLAPLKARPDMLARMRVFVVSHGLEPHEAAIPYMLAGMRLGNARMAGMGGHVQRYFLDRETDPTRFAPYSYVLTPNSEIPTDNLTAATAIGLHPGSARPLALKLGDGDTFGDLLARAHLTPEIRPAIDGLLALHSDQFAARHVTLAGEALRSRALTDHAFASAGLRTAPELAAVLGSDLLMPVGGEACGDSNALDTTRVGIRAAASLLRNPLAPARYVQVVDGGLIPADGGGGYDTHFDHPLPQARNLSSTLQSLADYVNAPGEGDPSKIDLDETMVLLTSEFGRTPYLQIGSGTNHYPYAFVVVMIGGAIKEQHAGLYGLMDSTFGAPVHVTPPELRAAALAAMGIWPFSSESFAVGDLRNADTEVGGLKWLVDDVLGRAS